MKLLEGDKLLDWLQNLILFQSLSIRGLLQQLNANPHCRFCNEISLFIVTLIDDKGYYTFLSFFTFFFLLFLFFLRFTFCSFIGYLFFFSAFVIYLRIKDSQSDQTSQIVSASSCPRLQNLGCETSGNFGGGGESVQLF